MIVTTVAAGSDPTFASVLSGARLTATVLDATPAGVMLAPYAAVSPILLLFLVDEPPTEPGTPVVTEAGHATCTSIRLRSKPWLRDATASDLQPSVHLVISSSLLRLWLVDGLWNDDVLAPPFRITRSTPPLDIRALLDFVFDSQLWNVACEFCVVAISDDIATNSADATITYDIVAAGTDSTAHKPGTDVVLPTAVRIVSVSWPRIEVTRLRVAAMVGLIVTLVGHNLAADLELTVETQLGPVARANMSVSSDTTELRLLTPPVSSKGYLAITVVESATGMTTTYDELFFTDDCPYEG